MRTQPYCVLHGVHSPNSGCPSRPRNDRLPPSSRHATLQSDAQRVVKCLVHAWTLGTGRLWRQGGQRSEPKRGRAAPTLPCPGADVSCNKPGRDTCLPVGGGILTLYSSCRNAGQWPWGLWSTQTFVPCSRPASQPQMPERRMSPSRCFPFHFLYGADHQRGDGVHVPEDCRPPADCS